MSRETPSSAITAANSEVKAILGNESKKGHGHYHKLSPEIKADLCSVVIIVNLLLCAGQPCDNFQSCIWLLFVVC